MAPLTVGLVQQAYGPNPEQNLAKLEAGIRQAKSKGAQLVVLQELHNGPYFCQVEAEENFEWGESIPGPSTERFGALAKELEIVLVLSLFEKRGPGLYHNSAVVLESDGSIAGTYRKSHIPDDPGYYEKYYFTPGDTGFQPIKTSVGTLGVLVCWDQWFPEAARLMVLAGAELLIYPTAIGYKPEDPDDEHRRQVDAWTTVQRGHSIANCTPVIAVNRVGYEVDPGPAREGMQFWGHSFVTGPQGEFLVRGGLEEEVLVTEIDTDWVGTVRRSWPFLRDRRVDLYGDLTKLYRK